MFVCALRFAHLHAMQCTSQRNGPTHSQQQQHKEKEEEEEEEEEEIILRSGASDVGWIYTHN